MCSYCGCDSIEVVGRFMAEHVEIINATGQLRRAVASGDTDAVQVARDSLSALLFPHTTTEEVGLFAVMRRETELAEHIDALCAEHQSLDDLLNCIAAGDYSLMGDFELLLRDHIDKEDNSLFPAAAIWLGGDEWTEVNTLTHDHDHAWGIAHSHHGSGDH